MTAVMRPIPSTSRFQCDRSLATLRDRAPTWAALPIDDRIEYLRSVQRRVIEAAPGMVGAAVRSKGVDERYTGEDWVSGIVTTLRTVRFLIETLETIARTGSTATTDEDLAVRPDGQVTVRVMPADAWDRVLYRGMTADVWIDPEVGLGEIDDHLGSFYTKAPPDPGVGLVLGAGNVASIGPLDVVHKLIADGSTAIVKFNPVNDYIGPFVERMFDDLITDGFVRTSYGGADVGSYLIGHPDVDEIHITGAASSHDAIVFGPGVEGERRKAAGTPIMTKPFTSELGNVSPVIIVPGAWKARDIRFQAERVATMMMQNNGFLCVAAKVLVMHRDWPQKDEFLDALRRVLLALPSRPAYYPGTEDRYDRFVASHPSIETLGVRKPGVVPPTLLVGVPPEAGHLAFTEEAFCSLAATTELGGEGAAGFLEAAVEFCNESVTGTLSTSILIDPDTQRHLGPVWDRAVASLRYGTVAVNVWSGAGYGLGMTPWGGYPGAAIVDIQSGIGFVHNARLIDRPQKTVISWPFRLFPKPAWFVTHKRTAAAQRLGAYFEADPSVKTALPLIAAGLRS